eukprot:TRINITY_DN5833_c1_g1_i1.p1 TRINITY_DN5833_c1_g1~~TRINITY_DN5833_c1_g1_i1.p1  ORF type:complete len:466 (+),score=109.55 TRINITY_DN5833_c1_g1_i1:79-1476(+)
MLRCFVGSATAAGGLWYLSGSDFVKGTPPGVVNLEQTLSTDKVLHGKYDVVVVGGGIIGVATANEILKRYPSKKVAIVEKEAAVAMHQSGHNSGVIHAGMYYEPGSKMAACCVEGADLMYDYAEKKKIPCKRIGKLIVATNAEEDKQVQKLYHQGVANGVKDLKVLTGPQVRAIEPNVAATSALDSPNTGIIDYGEVTRSLAKDFQEAGGSIKFNFAAENFDVQPNGKLQVSGMEQQQKGPLKIIETDHLITCAGLWMDKVGQAGGGEVGPMVTTFRGTYHQMKPEYRNIVKRNIYPVPTGGGIPTGVHFTPTVNKERGEQMIIGPGACLTLHKEGYKFTDFSFTHVFDIITNVGFWNFALGNFDMAVTEMYRDISRKAFLDQARKLVPSVTDDMVETSFAGVMAQVFTDAGGPEKDYIFDRKKLSGTTLHLRNAPSPAATSSLALAKKLIDVAEEDFEWKTKSA